MGDQYELAELILYAEPGGELGARCAELWAATSVSDLSTTAQEYPPHVTLTGFFRRHRERIGDVRLALTDALDAAVPAGLDGVRWAGPVTLEFQANDDWVGLHVQAAWMDAVVAAFVAHTRTQPAAPGEDPLRPKAWLHVSLAYGEQFEALGDVDDLDAPAAGFVGLTGESSWTVSLWERADPGWIRLESVEVTASSTPADL